MGQRDVVIVAFPGVSGLELFVSVDVLTTANGLLTRQGRPAAYRVRVQSLDGGDVHTLGGLTLRASGSLRDYGGAIDTLIVPGGPEGAAASTNAALVQTVQQLAGRARRVVSFSTGTFILAAAGLLDRRRATTHWKYGQLLAERHPSVLVDTNPIFIRDGAIATSAGVTAAIDLLLTLVEEDLGTEMARAIAQTLVLFLRRTGNQAQFSAQLSAQLADRQPIRDLQQFIADQPDANLSLEVMAERVHMSPRHFTRVFRIEVGLSPRRYVERVRVETARRRLEESDMPLAQIASACGFGSTESLRRVFVRAYGIPPVEYRRRYCRWGDRIDLHLVG